MPIDPRSLFLPPDASLKQAISIIDAHPAKIALAVDAAERLLGTVTDGDIRRGLLRGLGLATAVEEVMNRKPTTLAPDADHSHILELFHRLELRHIPVVDQDGRVIGLELLDSFLYPEALNHPVVIMAGGEGRRLRPLTETIPKPMLPVGGRPILETIIGNLAVQGLRNLTLAVHYRAEAIYGHFGDGTAHGVRIRYLREPRPLGTAGALTLLPERPRQAFLVTNGDVLTNLDYRDLLRYHQRSRAKITICVQQYAHTVPFGVVTLDHDRVVALEEKPVIEHFVSSGIYVLEPEVLDLLTPDQVCDMPQLIDRVLVRQEAVGAFPIREYWMDVGRPEDLHRAHQEYGAVFGG